MPNFTSNQLFVRGDKDRLQSFREAIRGRDADVDFEQIMPMPGGKEREAAMADERNIQAAILCSDETDKFHGIVELGRAAFSDSDQAAANEAKAEYGPVLAEILELYREKAGLMSEDEIRQALAEASPDLDFQIRFDMQWLRSEGFLAPIQMNQSFDEFWGARGPLDFGGGEYNEYLCSDSTDQELHYSFVTAWNPPMKMYDYMAGQWPDLEFVLAADDEGSNLVYFYSWENGERLHQFKDEGNYAPLANLAHAADGVRAINNLGLCLRSSFDSDDATNLISTGNTVVIHVGCHEARETTLGPDGELDLAGGYDNLQEIDPEDRPYEELDVVCNGLEFRLEFE